MDCAKGGMFQGSFTPLQIYVVHVVLPLDTMVTIDNNRRMTNLFRNICWGE